MSAARGARSRFAEAGVLTALAAGVLLDAQGYPPPLVEGAPGPAFFPRLVALLLLGCAVGLAFGVRRKPAPGKAREPGRRAGAAGDRAAEDAGETRRELRRWGAALGVAGFLLAVPLLGSLAALPVLMGGLMYLSGERSYRVLIAVPLGFAGLLHFLFEWLLGVPLP